MSGDHVTSPFRPGYGKRPLVFGGHQQAIEELTEVAGSSSATTRARGSWSA